MIIRERYLAQIRPFNNKDLIKVITGFRRNGKSVLLEAISRNYHESVGKIHGKERDFLLQKGKEVLYIQVAYLLADQTMIDREFSVYLQVQDHHKKYVVSMNQIDFSQDGIIHRNIEDFLYRHNGNSHSFRPDEASSCLVTCDSRTISLEYEGCYE